MTFARATNSGMMDIDGEKIGNSKSGGSTRSINVKSPYYVGGIPNHYRNISSVKTNLKVSSPVMFTFITLKSDGHLK